MGRTFEETVEWSREEESVKGDGKKKQKLSVSSVATGAVIFGLPLAVIGAALLMGKGTDEGPATTLTSHRLTRPVSPAVTGRAN